MQVRAKCCVMRGLLTQGPLPAAREALQAKFPWLKFHNPHDDPIGPHPIGMWEADFVHATDVPAQFGQVVSWLMLNHGTHPVLIHPNTGRELADHTTHAIWLGERLSLKLHYLKD